MAGSPKSVAMVLALVLAGASACGGGEADGSASPVTPESTYAAFGGEAVVEGTPTGTFEEVEVAGLHHRVTELDVEAVLHLRPTEELGDNPTPNLPLGPVSVFEVLGDSTQPSQPSRFEELAEGGSVVVVLDFETGNVQADAVGPWGVSAVGIEEKTGTLRFLGDRQAGANDFLGAARAVHVPDRFADDLELLVGLVDEAGNYQSTEVIGPLGSAAMSRLRDST